MEACPKLQLMITVKSISKSIKISEVDEEIFRKKYFAHCLSHPFCRDICCSYGCQIDMAEVNRILAYAGQLEAKFGIPASQWFEEEVIKDADYPSGEAVRTKIHRGKCAFHDHEVLGCGLHRFATQEGMDQHLIKPMICALFPVTWEKGHLFVSSFLDELPCRDQGVPIFEAQKDELRVYFGEDLVSELEQIAFQMNLAKIDLKPIDKRLSLM
jgi:Fe-S-cluster containining protein